uniref:ribosomal protein L32 n=1 Tax=Xyris indica TaxID=2919641 RepID=UPI001F12F71E|nr:ribosomal protein L32 [Xyris indica]ULQ68369.1 ribosomal protein L32 [Xyris indica]ULQ68449.1 ribosomal protein L32 [Xyris indica]ULQ68686.1 ribosomal protein L32 [Xyris indica]
MAVPKKRTSISKKRIRRKIWEKKSYLYAMQALSLAKSIVFGDSQTKKKSSFVKQTKNRNEVLGFGKKTKGNLNFPE